VGSEMCIRDRYCPLDCGILTEKPAGEEQQAILWSIYRLFSLAKPPTDQQSMLVSWWKTLIDILV
ncbi:hypothetical protein Q2941_33620, partial [Bradyrhizobium sp. UFLA05-153]